MTHYGFKQRTRKDSDEVFDFGGIATAVRERINNAGTGKSFLIKMENEDEFWVPDSVIHPDSEVYNVGDKGKLIVRAWWAEAHGHL